MGDTVGEVGVVEDALQAIGLGHLVLVNEGFARAAQRRRHGETHGLQGAWPGLLMTPTVASSAKRRANTRAHPRAGCGSGVELPCRRDPAMACGAMSGGSACVPAGVLAGTFACQSSAAFAFGVGKAIGTHGYGNRGKREERETQGNQNEKCRGQNGSGVKLTHLHTTMIEVRGEC